MSRSTRSRRNRSVNTAAHRHWSDDPHEHFSSRLSASDPSILHLQLLINAGRIVFVPFGGGNLAAWTDRFAPLGCPELHLYDSEVHPETERRHAAVTQVTSRQGCRAFLTSKRALENYLHPQAIAAAGGGEIAFGDDDCVTSVLARAWFEPGRIWRDLPGNLTPLMMTAKNINADPVYANCEGMCAVLRLNPSEPRNPVHDHNPASRLST